MGKPGRKRPHKAGRKDPDLGAFSSLLANEKSENSPTAQDSDLGKLLYKPKAQEEETNLGGGKQGEDNNGKTADDVHSESSNELALSDDDKEDDDNDDLAGNLTFDNQATAEAKQPDSGASDNESSSSDESTAASKKRCKSQGTSNPNGLC